MKYFFQIVSELFLIVHVSHPSLLATLGSLCHAILSLPPSLTAPSLSISTTAATSFHRPAVHTPFRGSFQSSFSPNPLSVFNYKDLNAHDPHITIQFQIITRHHHQMPAKRLSWDSSWHLELATSQVHYLIFKSSIYSAKMSMVLSDSQVWSHLWLQPLSGPQPTQLPGSVNTSTCFFLTLPSPPLCLLFGIFPTSPDSCLCLKAFPLFFHALICNQIYLLQNVFLYWIAQGTLLSTLYWSIWEQNLKKSKYTNMHNSFTLL